MKFFEMLEEKLNKLNSAFNGYYNVFNNSKEQGFQLILYTDNVVEDSLCIWSCMDGNSDKIMVVIGDLNCSDKNNGFDDKAYKCAKYFNYDNYNSAIEYTLNVLKKNYPKHLNANYNYKFNCNKNLAFIEKIINHAEYFDYEDHHDLATFEEGDYFCDLIIIEGKVGIRYSKYLDSEHTDFENIHFEEFEPNLSSDVALMLEMKQKLNNFVDAEIDYQINYGIDGVKM